MTTQAQQHTDDVAPTVNGGAGTAASRLLPSATPIRFLDDAGGVAPAADHGAYESPPIELLLEAYRRMVVGRRFDAQATALTKQGRLAVYPSSHGQEACQIGGVLALRDTDWMFPTYRESMALVARGIDPVEALTLLRGDWHCGYDPVGHPHRTAVHAAGHPEPCTRPAWPTPARRRGEDTVALAFVGDGGTSEGDFHEALNFAAVFRAPVVFLVQNNRYAISRPAGEADRGTVAGATRVSATASAASRSTATTRWRCSPCCTTRSRHARAGDGPVPGRGAHLPDRGPHQRRRRRRRYRDDAEVAAWAGRDPLSSARDLPHATGALSDEDIGAARQEAEAFAGRLRDADERRPRRSIPLSLFDHVFAKPTPQLREQRDMAASRSSPRQGRQRERAPMTTTMAQALNAALRDAMTDDDSVVVFGEDVGTLGGVFRITDGLAGDLGEDRCFDTPLAESGHRRIRARAWR